MYIIIDLPFWRAMRNNEYPNGWSAGPITRTVWVRYLSEAVDLGPGQDLRAQLLNPNDGLSYGFVGIPELWKKDHP